MQFTRHYGKGKAPADGPAEGSAPGLRFRGMLHWRRRRSDRRGFPAASDRAGSSSLQTLLTRRGRPDATFGQRRNLDGMIRHCLLAASLLVVPSIASAQSVTPQSVTPQSVTPSSHGVGSTCGKAPAAMDRKCVMVIPEIVVYGLVSDAGPDYDSQGNPIDRYSNIIATRARADSRREVFAIEQRR